MRRRITEGLDLELNVDRIGDWRWRCHDCGHDLGPAAENYKKGCLLHSRKPDEIWPPQIDEAYTFSYNPGWMRLVEFYCPGCGTLIELEVLPPGHPLTHDIELDLESLRLRVLAEDGDNR
jgi:acetone carboxylase, gamma subunit